MKNQTGARYIKRQRASLRADKVICTNHVKTESNLERLPSGAVKRIK